MSTMMILPGTIAPKAPASKSNPQVTDYILDHNYQIIDWDGKRTLWGWWSPELLNEEPGNYLESGIYSLIMLSFLKPLTPSPAMKNLEHYRKLIEEHDYLSNLLLQKKVSPDELNHSDDQLSALVFYYMLWNRTHSSAMPSRHAATTCPHRTRQHNSLFALSTLFRIPRIQTSSAASKPSEKCPKTATTGTATTRHGLMSSSIPKPRTTASRSCSTSCRPTNATRNAECRSLPGRISRQRPSEGAGVHYLLPYWMGRYHGLITAPTE